MVTKKSGKSKHLRVDGSVSILAYNAPSLGLNNCSTPVPISYSAYPCRYADSPSYVSGSLPLCSAAPIGSTDVGCDATTRRDAPADRIVGDGTSAVDAVRRCG